MNKTQLIDAVADGTGMSKAVAEKMLDVAIDTITRALKDGDSVTIVGFGTFRASERAARSGRNPRTGEAIDIKAARIPKFSAGKAFKDALNWRPCCSKVFEARETASRRTPRVVGRTTVRCLRRHATVPGA